MAAVTENPVVRLFDQVAAVYDRSGPRFFSHFGEILADAARIRAGDRVLDLACGRGASLLPAARRTGEGGRVVGIDLSEGMVREARADARRAGLRQVEVRRMNAQRIDFPDECFDAVLSGFSLNLFSRPLSVLRQACRVLAPGSRIAVSVWADDCEYFLWILDRIRRHSSVTVRPPQGPLTTPDGLHRALSGAGFDGSDPEVVEAEFFYRDEAQWWSSLASYGFRGALDVMDPGSRDGLRADCREKIESLSGKRGIRMLLRALVATGVKPRDRSRAA